MTSIINFFKLIRNHLGWFLMLCLVVLGGSIFEAFSVGSVLPFVDVLQDPEAVLKYNRHLQNWGLAARSYPEMVALIAGLLAIAYIAKNILLIASNFLQALFQNLVRVSLSTGIYRNYLYRDFGFFVNNAHGMLLQRLTTIVDQATGALSMGIRMVVNLISILAVYAVFAMASLKMTALLTVIIVVLSIAAWALSRYRAYQTGREIVTLEGLQFSTAAETIGGMRIIRAFGAEKMVRKRYKRIVRRLARIRVINTTLFSLPTPTIETLIVVAICGAIIWQSDSRGEGFAALIPLMSMFGVGMIRIMQKVSASYSDAMQIANLLPAVDAAVDLMKPVTSLQPHNETKPFEGLKESISFEHVSFGYDRDKDSNVITDVNIRLRKGRFTAIVGPSGSGKSTLVDLLLGLYRPSHGRISIDGHIGLNRLDMAQWRSCLGLVSQDTFLFNGTIAENIALAESRKADRAQIEHAAHLANADHFIGALSEGYDTVIGERGLKLSGGERQRLAIARALYRNPSILMLDEATSSLDTHAEQEVQQAINGLRGERTMLVIAHRLSTIVHADWIYVLNQGRVTESGTHTNLIAAGGLYAQLCKKQMLNT